MSGVLNTCDYKSGLTGTGYRETGSWNNNQVEINALGLGLSGLLKFGGSISNSIKNSIAPIDKFKFTFEDSVRVAGQQAEKGTPGANSWLEENAERIKQ